MLTLEKLTKDLNFEKIDEVLGRGSSSSRSGSRKSSKSSCSSSRSSSRSSSSSAGCGGVVAAWVGTGGAI